MIDRTQEDIHQDHRLHKLEKRTSALEAALVALRAEFTKNNLLPRVVALESAKK